MLTHDDCPTGRPNPVLIPEWWGGIADVETTHDDCPVGVLIPEWWGGIADNVSSLTSDTWSIGLNPRMVGRNC